MRNTESKSFLPVGIIFFLQAGKQLEHFTGGLIEAVWHEVVVNDKTLAVSDSDANIFLCTHLAFINLFLALVTRA